MSTLIEQKVSLSEVKEMAKSDYEFMIKGCVDIVQEKMALGGEYHIEACELLQKTYQSKTADVWGFNIVFSDMGYDLEYDSLINIKPEVNRSRTISNEETQRKVKEIIEKFVS